MNINPANLTWHSFEIPGIFFSPQSPPLRKTFAKGFCIAPLHLSCVLLFAAVRKQTGKLPNFAYTIKKGNPFYNGSRYA